jgi:hypothetical protein
MKWTYKFETPIMLKDGRSIVSLVHARDLLIDLPAFARSARIGSKRPIGSLRLHERVVQTPSPGLIPN